MNILYIGIAHSSDPAIAFFSQSLTRSFHLSRHNTYIYGDSLFCEYFKSPKIITSEQISSIAWDIVVVQNSLSFIKYSKIMQYLRLRTTPIIYISFTDDIYGNIAPFDNLYAVLSTGVSNLMPWNIPNELCKQFHIPVIASKNHYRYDEQPENYEFIYYPGKNSTTQTTKTIIHLTHLFKCRLSFVGEEYRILESAMDKRVHIIPRKQAIVAMKRAHLVLASRYEAMQAIALCKPCVIIGDHGLGGRVTPENYETFKRHGFKGRNGAAFGEDIPLNLLQFDIQRTMNHSCVDDVNKLHALLLAEDYSFNSFHKIIVQTVKQVLKLHDQLQHKKSQRSLKPKLTSTFHIKKNKNKNIIFCGQTPYTVASDNIEFLLRQCDGTKTIEEILFGNGYQESDIRVFTENIIKLWKKKLVVFHL